MIYYTKRIFKLLFGLFFGSWGIVMTMKANIGFLPWDTFHQGIANATGLTIGKVIILIGFTLCILCLFLGEKFGIGTILDMALVGLLIDMNLSLNYIPQMNTYISGIALMLTGLLIISIGTFFYISSGFCIGPRDNLMVAIRRKTGLAVGFSRGIIETSAVLIGWLLGGPVGIGTILSAFGISFCIQIVFSIMKFDPTKVKHETLATTSKMLTNLKTVKNENL